MMEWFGGRKSEVGVFAVRVGGVWEETRRERVARINSGR